MGTVAVAVDGTEASAAALAAAVALARSRGARLTGVFVLDTGWADFIGNDWQSSRNARQGFLDYVLERHTQQAGIAKQQFELAAGGLAASRFVLLSGDPEQVLAGFMKQGEAELLVLGGGVFRECARPSVRRLGRALARRLGEALVLI